MRKKLWINLALALVIPGLLFTASCVKKVVKKDVALTQQAEDEAVKEAAEKAKQEELARQRAIEEGRLREEAAASYAEETPKIVIDAFEAYKKSSFEDAAKIWYKGSPMENDTTTKMNLKSGITKIETIYGKMIGYEVLDFLKISPSTNRTYAVILYEKGPLFMYVDCYKSPNGWIIPELVFNPRAHMILPREVLFEQ